MTRFAGRDAFAASNGTVPMEVSFGKRKACRLPRLRELQAELRHPWLRSTGRHQTKLRKIVKYGRRRRLGVRRRCEAASYADRSAETDRV